MQPAAPQGIYRLFDVGGRVVLVTGGANGLGRMIAGAFAAGGARVYVTSRKAEDAERAAAEMVAEGGICTGLAADLSDPAGATTLAGQIAERESALHVLINNAGRSWGAPLARYPDKGWAPIMSINVQTPFTLVRDLLPLLRSAARPDDPARVINVGSVAGRVVEPISAYAYSASKAGLAHLGRVMAADLAPEGITVNTLVPGYFPTSMTGHIRADEAASAELLARIPLGRMGSPEDAAGLCLMLASRAGAYLTGTEIVMDGGLSGCR
ncbi:SDR family oxidoreductase [Gemmobacter sp.]|uniref:SDR family oxidoreductase n=1 Tax=Gemmobacter sp. TaxID=1898957 RepID=UPI002AFF55C6|nr:SDR family oxidoreductase [Gemmobacter sp.]